MRCNSKPFGVSDVNYELILRVRFSASQKAVY